MRDYLLEGAKSAWICPDDGAGQALREEKIIEWRIFASNEAIEINDILEQDGEKPWDKAKDFLQSDVDGELQITLADGVYVFAENLTTRIQTRIRELAACQGRLRESRFLAVEAMLKHETGILHAATAFGKTVVCCNMIARKR